MDVIKALNDLRKANKDKWVFYSDNGIKYKAYNTWVQILEVNGIRHNSRMDISVKEYLSFLTGVLGA
jgi:ribosomal protein L20A (L18A)